MQDKTSAAFEKAANFAQESIQNVKEYAQNKVQSEPQKEDMQDGE